MLDREEEPAGKDIILTGKPRNHQEKGFGL